MKPSTHVAAVLLALICACSTKSASGPTEAGASVGAPCVSAEDCTGPTLCAFPTDAGCKARGHCVMEDIRCTGTGQVVCACDGTPVQLSCGYGAGNAPAPVPSPLSTSTTSCLPPPDTDGAADAAAD